MSNYVSDSNIIQLQPEHRQDWLQLYRGYAEHYQVNLSSVGTTTTWNWLMDTQHVLTGLVATAPVDPQAINAGFQLTGLAHFRAMPSPLRGDEIGFLDDLYVDPAWRGQGVAQQLILAVQAAGKSRGWRMVRWITRASNDRAMAVYDRLALHSDWQVYEMSCNKS